MCSLCCSSKAILKSVGPKTLCSVTKNVICAYALPPVYTEKDSDALDLSVRPCLAWLK